MKNILLVDDEKQTADIVILCLKREDVRFRYVSNGRACLDAVKEERPDLIIMDVMMPEMDGYTAAAELASEEGTRSIPILMLTGKAQMAEAFQMSSNVADCLPKPFDPNVLRERVKSILERKG